jgi:hypothetical protein
MWKNIVADLIRNYTKSPKADSIPYKNLFSACIAIESINFSLKPDKSFCCWVRVFVTVSSRLITTAR